MHRRPNRCHVWAGSGKLGQECRGVRAIIRDTVPGWADTIVAGCEHEADTSGAQLSKHFARL